MYIDFNGYSYAPLYMLEFKDFNNREWGIYIYADDIDDTGGRFEELIPSDNPFEWKNNNTEDQTHTIRGATGNITFVCRDSEVLSRLQAYRHQSRLVEIINTELDFTWYGFLATDVLSQKYNDFPNTVSLPFVSCLELADKIDYLSYDRAKGVHTLGDILFACLDKLYPTVPEVFTNQKVSTLDAFDDWSKVEIVSEWLYSIDEDSRFNKYVKAPMVGDVLRKLFYPHGTISEYCGSLYIEAPIRFNNLMNNIYTVGRNGISFYEERTYFPFNEFVKTDNNHESRTSGVSRCIEVYSFDQNIAATQINEDDAKDIQPVRSYFADHIWYVQCSSRQQTIWFPYTTGFYRSEFVIAKPTGDDALMYDINPSDMGLCIHMHNELLYEQSSDKYKLGFVLKSFMPLCLRKMNNRLALVIDTDVRMWNNECYQKETKNGNTTTPTIDKDNTRIFLKVGSYALTSLNYNNNPRQVWTPISSLDSRESKICKVYPNGTGGFIGIGGDDELNANHDFACSDTSLVIPLDNHPTYQNLQNGQVALVGIEFGICYPMAERRSDADKTRNTSIVTKASIDVVSNSSLSRLFDKAFMNDRKVITTEENNGAEVELKYNQLYYDDSLNTPHHNYQPVALFSRTHHVKMEPLHIIELRDVDMQKAPMLFIGNIYTIKGVKYRILSIGCNSGKSTYYIKLIEL